MATNQTHLVIRHLRTAALQAEGAGLTDGELLESFVSRRETAALEALVRRHGPMVWGVCRRILRDHHDAEDVFQATFLVLVRKAASVRPREMVGNWLYGVALQTARKARAMRAKRRTRERQVTDMPEPAVANGGRRDDLQELLDQELSRLPDKYRVAIVLCDLEGRTRKEVARQLDISDGALWGRLARARALLARRLARHGLVVPGAALGGVLAESASASVPASVVVSTIRIVTLVAIGQGAATGVVSAPVAALAEGVVKAMLLSKLRSGLVVLMVVALLAAVGLSLGSLGAAGPVPPGEAPRAAAGPDKGAEELRATILALDKQFWEASSKHDLDTLKKFVADDFVSFTPDGTRWNKAALLEQHRRVRTAGLKIIGEREVFRVHAQAALLTYEFTYSIHDRGGQLLDRAHLRATSCWAQRNNRWVVVFSQVTTVPAPAPAPQVEKKDKPVAATPKTDQEALQGAWQVVAVETNGKEEKQPWLDRRRKEEWVVEGKFITVRSRADSNDPLVMVPRTKAFAVRPDRAPKEIDINPYWVGFRFESDIQKGIYTLDGDLWKVCFPYTRLVAPPKQVWDRPKVMVTKEGSSTILITLKRVKARKASAAPATKDLLEKGPFQLRALEPSERPRLADLTEAKRFAALQAARDVSIFAARDERESFGAVVMGLGGHALTAKVTELKGPRGGVIPASAVRVRWAEGVAVNGVMVPDPLLEEQPFQPPRGIAPMLWVTVHVPRSNVPAGAYRGILTAESKGRTASLPITLEVFDFALPKTSYLQSSFWMFRHTIRNYYEMKTVPFDFYRQFLDRCLETRLSPIDAAAYHDQPFVQIVRDKKGEFQVDWTEWDRYLGYCMERGMTAFNVGDEHWFGSYFHSFSVRDLKTGKTETVTLKGKQYDDTVVRFFRLAREHFTKKGWASRAYLQGYDEPEADNAKLLAGIKHFYGLARKGWPELRTLITAPPQRYAALHKSVGIWCPLTAEYWDAEADKCRKRGEEMWWYVCKNTTPPWANFFLDQSGATHRVLFWQTFARRADGFLFWGVNFWPGFEARTMKPPPADKKWPKVPWNDAGWNGDGYFLYPGPNGPLTSLRFEIMRDGVEDYDALRMLADLLAKKGERVPAPLRERARQALAVSPDVFRSMTNYPTDASAMVKRRRLVNELIVLFANCR
jgi:RNA polymerase sigma factor (sigma-70 family)